MVEYIILSNHYPPLPVHCQVIHCASYGRILCPHLIWSGFGHVTCFGQWNVSKYGIYHVGAENLRLILSFGQFSCSFPDMSYAEAVLSGWVLKSEDRTSPGYKVIENIYLLCSQFLSQSS